MSKKQAGTGEAKAAPAAAQEAAEAPASPVPVLTVPAAAAAATARVYLSETSRLTEWVDPQTHLRVTREPQEVVTARIGEAARREPAVRIEASRQAGPLATEV